ncbi:MAG: alpha/beta hydrolase, partial [Azoarcus sp.]|nr:alpha/beta hydrolase [Azoarcus sp.]
MTHLLVKGTKFHVVELNPEGTRTIIMLHGLFANTSFYLFSVAPKLAKRYRVVLYDMRSHGMSERRDEGYSLEILSDDLLALMHELNIDRTCLVGHSYGGSVSLYTALRHPDKVERLALIEALSLQESEPAPLKAGGSAASDFLENEVEEHMRSLRFPVPESRIMKMRAQIREQYRVLSENNLLKKAFSESRVFLDETPLEHLVVPTLLLYGNTSPCLETGRLFAARI